MNAQKLFEHAAKYGYAIGAFNAVNLETLKAIFNASKKLKSPVIIETSPGESAYLGIENLVSLVNVFRKETNIPVIINLDHAKESKNIIKALNAGFDLLHYDGSELPYEKNLKKLKQLVKIIHKKGALVEGEIDHIAGSSQPQLKTKIESKQIKSHYTDPEQARDFVKKSGCDILAVNIGNVHGYYANPPKLDLKRLEEIKKQAGCFMSLHGGSGINADDLKQAIKRGIVKVNVNTELRMAYLNALKISLKVNKNNYKIYEFMEPVISAVQKVVEEKIKIFGSNNKA